MELAENMKSELKEQLKHKHVKLVFLRQEPQPVINISILNELVSKLMNIGFNDIIFDDAGTNKPEIKSFEKSIVMIVSIAEPDPDSIRILSICVNTGLSIELVEFDKCAHTSNVNVIVETLLTYTNNKPAAITTNSMEPINRPSAFAVKNTARSILHTIKYNSIRNMLEAAHSIRIDGNVIRSDSYVIHPLSDIISEVITGEDPIALYIDAELKLDYTYTYNDIIESVMVDNILYVYGENTLYDTIEIITLETLAKGL